MDLGQIATGFATNPMAWISTLLLVAVGYLFREIRSGDRAALERTMAQEAAHRASLEKIIPVAEKLTDAVEILEKLSNRDRRAQ